MNNFVQYLQEQGMLNVPEKDLKKAHTMYRQNYQAEYRKKYKARMKRKEVLFTKDEYALLEQKSKEFGMKVCPFIRATCFAYLNSTFVVPTKNFIDELEASLRKASNNINQIVHASHIQQEVSQEDMGDLVTDVTQSHLGHSYILFCS